jgi:hypothetical protein
MTKLDIGARDFETEPARGVFAKRYATGKAQVVWCVSSPTWRPPSRPC